MTDEPDEDSVPDNSDEQSSGMSLSGLTSAMEAAEQARQHLQAMEDIEYPAHSVRTMLKSYRAAEDAVTTYQDVASIVAKEETAQSIQDSLAPAMAVVANSDALNHAGTAAALQQVVEQNRELSRNLSAIAQFTQNAETIQSALAAAARAADASQPPNALIADIATLRATNVPIGPLSSQLGQLYDEDVRTDNPSKPSSDDQEELVETDTEIDDSITTDYRQEPQIKYSWEARISEAHIGQAKQTGGQRATDIDTQLPISAAYNIVSEGETYRWLSSIPMGYQTFIIAVILYSGAVALGVKHPGALSLWAPAIRTAVFDTGDADN
jgi:nicotinamide mononucleotide adenylyltransferase